MSEKSEIAAKIRGWLSEVMRRHDLTSYAWEKRSGVAATTINRALKDNYEFVTSSRTIEKLANSIGEPIPNFSPNASIIPISDVPILGEVAAGYFGQQMNFNDNINIEYEKIPRAVIGYINNNLFALKIVGSSMNLDYPLENTFVIVCPYGETNARHNDNVIVEKENSDGLFEYTCKKLIFDGREWWLKPQSSDPRYQDAISIKQNGLRIVGVVVGQYTETKRENSIAFFGTDYHEEGQD